MGTMLASGNLPFFLAILTLLLCLLFRLGQGEAGGIDDQGATANLIQTLMVALSSWIAALSLAQAVLTKEVLYALLAAAIGGLLVWAGQRPRRGFEDEP